MVTEQNRKKSSFKHERFFEVDWFRGEQQRFSLISSLNLPQIDFCPRYLTINLKSSEGKKVLECKTNG